MFPFDTLFATRHDNLNRDTLILKFIADHPPAVPK